jgi:hypothetical protein
VREAQRKPILYATAASKRRSKFLNSHFRLRDSIRAVGCRRMRREYFSNWFFRATIRMNMQIKTTRFMRDDLIRNANKDGIFSEIVCLLSVRDRSERASSRKSVRDKMFLN